jgi:putative Holliday junction resolvase
VSRVLGIDWGVKRHGLAVSDPLGLAAHPVGTVECRGPDGGLGEIVRIAREKDVAHVVVGIPFHMDGRPGDHHTEVLAFVEQLRKALDLPVETIDERLTTVQAERALAEGGLSREKRKARVDQVAACFILRGWLDARAFREKLPADDASDVD